MAERLRSGLDGVTRCAWCGWTFVGPTTVYAFMQAMGIVDDHFVGCERAPH